MTLYLIIETMQRVPSASFMLMIFMSISAAILINHILDFSFVASIVAAPILLTSGLFMYSVLRINGIYLSPDRASNTALATSLGFVGLALFIFFGFRVWSRANDKT